MISIKLVCMAPFGGGIYIGSVILKKLRNMQFAMVTFSPFIGTGTLMAIPHGSKGGKSLLMLEESSHLAHQNMSN